MDPSDIPKQYGGNLDWEWGDMPNLDEPARELAGGLEIPSKGGKPDFVKGPLLFDGDKIRALGTVDGAPRRLDIPVPIVTKEQQQEVDLKSEREAEATATLAVTAAPTIVTGSTLSESLLYQNGSEKVASMTCSGALPQSLTPADISE